ncbi:MAG: AbrB/MazE/SpoVT family DNA-binding domain-containing protein [Rhodospirillales bacterium]|nr:MAG: AbrB/MazE/SpoVT family DNA-binding domain-containing protein [Rhodospirillales bacterium]
MHVIRLSSRGQLVLPAAMRNAHRWGPGDEFVVEEVPEGLLLLRRPRKPFPASRVDEVAGALRRLAGLPNVILEDAEQVAFAIDLASHDIDFADALHVAACREAGPLYTFDRRLIRQADVVGLSVSEPEGNGGRGQP